jgi:hypothetical protein
MTETMNEAQLIRDAVDEKLMSAGMRDRTLTDTLDLSGVKVADGKVDAKGVLAVLDGVLEKHPDWFKPWDKLPEKEFASEQEAMRERTRRRNLGGSGDEERLPVILVDDLNDNEERALRNYVHGRASEDDMQILRYVVKRQKAA